MMTLQDRYDDAMFDFSCGDFDAAIEKFNAILAEDPRYFDAQLALGMAYFRKGEFPIAIREGHKAEKLRPREQLVHTNLSLFYMKAGNKGAAEHHGLQARISSWQTQASSTPGGRAPAPEPSELEMAKTPSPVPANLPAQPWKKKVLPDGQPPDGGS